MKREDVVVLHSFATFADGVEHNECLMIPHEGESAVDFLRRICLRIQSLNDGFATLALFDPPPTTAVSCMAIGDIERSANKGDQEKQRVYLNSLMPWMGKRLTGKVGKLYAQCAGTLSALYKTLGSYHHVKS